MKLNKILFPILGWSAILSLQSCTDNDFKKLNSDIIGSTNFETKTEYFDVAVQNKTIKAIRSNNLPAYLLGEYSQAPFGKMNASVISQLTLPRDFRYFGEKSQNDETQKNESEQETVVSVKLNIPFFSTVKKTEIVEDKKTKTTYALDSIYGSKSAKFDVDVDEYQYYLKNIDNNLKNPQSYYSNFTIDQSLMGEKLASAKGISIDEKEVITPKFDNPLTTDKDESKEELLRVAPRFSVDLNKDFFQKKILDKEGTPELSSQDAFNLYFKSIIIKTSNFSEDLMMLLDFSKANIEIVYQYTTSTKDGKKYQQHNTVTLELSGTIVNKFSYENEEVDTLTSNDKIFLQGGKRFAELTFFSKEELNRIKNEDWLINDAVLYFNLDENHTVKQIPQQLYIYDAKTGAPLMDYNLDTFNRNNPSNTPAFSKYYNKRYNRYEIHIPNHITEIIKRNKENVTLGLVVAQNVRQEVRRIEQHNVTINHVAPIQYLKDDNSEGKIARTTATTPLGIILYGGNTSVNEDQRLRLKITYTKPLK